jgi:hypothetical protein
MAVEVVEQRLDHARLGQLLAVEPDRSSTVDGRFRAVLAAK